MKDGWRKFPIALCSHQQQLEEAAGLSQYLTDSRLSRGPARARFWIGDVWWERSALDIRGLPACEELTKVIGE